MADSRLATKGAQFYTPLVITAGLFAKAFLPFRPHVLVACMPKSGSTFLSNLIASYGVAKSGSNGMNKLISSYRAFKRVKLLPEYGDREQELCELRLLTSHFRSYVAQQHIRNSEWTQELIGRYGITPVALIRNLPDSVVSIRDHIRKEKNFGSIIQVNDNVLSLSDDKLDRLIVQVAMPWYLNFYEGWYQSQALIITYDEVVSEPGQTLTKVLVQAGVDVDFRLINRAVDRVNEKSNRLNVGVAGRGATLSADNRKRLEDLIDLFPLAASSEYLTRF